MRETPTVAQIMSPLVMMTRPDARLSDVARVLREFHISGLPVVDEDERVVGVISEKDLVRTLHKATGIGSPRGLLDLLLESAPAKGESVLEVCRRRLRNTRVRDVMTQPAVSVRPEVSIIDAARLMKLNGVNRLPVVDARERLFGIVTRCDIVDDLATQPSRVRGALHPAVPKIVSRTDHSDPFFDI